MLTPSRVALAQFPLFAFLRASSGRYLGNDLESIARELFAALRQLDDKGVQTIHVEGILESDDLAATIMNRLRKAAIQICT